MCMANLAAAPGNMVGSLWGDDTFGEKTLGYKMGKVFDKTMAEPTIEAPQITAQPQVETVTAQQRRSLIS